MEEGGKEKESEESERCGEKKEGKMMTSRREIRTERCRERNEQMMMLRKIRECERRISVRKK